MTSSKDRIITALGFEGQVVAYIADTHDLVEEMRRRHDTWPVVTAALGRTATLGAILGSTLKHEKHQVTLQVQGDGPIGRILVVATGSQTVRGYADEPHIMLDLKQNGKLDVSRAVGTEGSVTVIKDLGLREPYRGSVPIVSGEIGEDFTYYFAVSEQTPSAVTVGVLVDRDYSVKRAGGLLLQVLPQTPTEVIDAMEKRLAALPSMTTMLEDGARLEDILTRVLGDDVQIVNEQSVMFACTCSKERLAGILQTLGHEELTAMREEQYGAELVCHFCGEKYQFDAFELQALIDHIHTNN